MSPPSRTDRVLLSLSLDSSPQPLRHTRVDDADLSAHICTEAQVPLKLAAEAAERSKQLRAALSRATDART